MMTKKNFYVEFSDSILYEECPLEIIVHLFSSVVSAKASGGLLVLNGMMI
jgi:hypothetical protein